jgi:ribokinase
VSSSPSITVVGSVNLDLVARVERLPRPGETVTGATFARVKGGKGANQAVACARLGAEVTLVCSVGTDVFADEALPQEERLTLVAARVEAPTGVALILVDAGGENQIAVAPGANAELRDFELPASDAVLAQLEIPDDAVRRSWEQAGGLYCLNAAPARPVDVDADLTVVNRFEFEALRRRDGIVAVTLGAEGAILIEDGEEIARAQPPHVEAVDGTAAGDAFTACLLVSWLEGLEPEAALRRACAAGALAASRFGAQPSLPTAAEIDGILAA